MDTLLKDNLTGQNHEGKKANTPVRYLTASSIIGDKVYNREDEKLGEIKDVMIDIHDGKVDYFVIEFGGFLGIGEKFFAIPASMLKVNEEKQGFTFDQKKNVLNNAPGFDKDHWPDTNAHDFQESTTYWGGFMGSNTGREY